MEKDTQAYKFNDKKIISLRGFLDCIIDEAEKYRAKILSLEEIISLRSTLPSDHPLYYPLWLGEIVTRELVVYTQEKIFLIKDDLSLNQMLSALIFEDEIYKAISEKRPMELKNKELYEYLLKKIEEDKEQKRILILPPKNFNITLDENFDFFKNLVGEKNANKYFETLQKLSQEKNAFPFIRSKEISFLIKSNIEPFLQKGKQIIAPLKIQFNQLKGDEIQIHNEYNLTALVV